jgi:5-methylcytosine-specific restriction endonuclease McrA
VIRLELGPEPPALATARVAGIARVAALPSPRKGSQITGYRDPTYHELHRRQYGKCAWCERPVGRTGEPVEHVRPKAGADDARGVRSPDHYWWLAWSWENLVFSCSSCNSPGNKANKYWLLPGTPRLPPPTLPVTPSWFDVSAEQPVLVHPRREDPLDFLEWRLVDRRAARHRWRWTIRGRDRAKRGSGTMAILGLKAVVDQVNAHLRGLLAMDRELQGHLQAGRGTDAEATWERMITTYLTSPKQIFRAAAWWAIQSLRPAGFRAPPRPGVRW